MPCNVQSSIYNSHIHTKLLHSSQNQKQLFSQKADVAGEQSKQFGFGLEGVIICGTLSADKEV